jgi:predicted ATPase
MGLMARGGVMVGRAAEQATVRSLVDGVRRGWGGVALVSGEAGIGKTRLLREAAERARDAGLAVVSGRAVEGGGTYRPLTEALLDQLWEASPDFSEEPSCRAVLGRLLPGWAGAGGMSLNVDPALVVGEAVLSLLRVVGGDHGCLMVPACDDEPLSGVLSRLIRREEVTALRLGRLTTAEVEALAEHRTDGLPLAEAGRRFVVEHADGLPYLVEELVAGMLESAQATDPGRGTPAVPQGLVSRVAARLAALEPAQRCVLEAAAVLGTDPDWTILSTVTGAPEPPPRTCSSRQETSCAGGTR